MCDSAPVPSWTRSRVAGSGDLRADRRFAYAAAASAQGDHAVAADLLEQTLALAPDWAAGWLALGLAREAAGTTGADDALRRAVTLDPSGELGAGAHLARLEGRRPAGLGEEHVRALFDDYAPRFEAHLVGALGYAGPRILDRLLERVAPGAVFARALDLGCGTGLVARAFGPRVGRIEGVDLSPAMVAIARATGLYERVEVAEAVAALDREPAGARDLVVAADVLCYVGSLLPLFGALARVLAPGGLFAATCQSAPDPDFLFGADMRFSHSAAYLRACADAAGLAVAALEEASTRHDGGVAVPGLAMVFVRA